MKMTLVRKRFAKDRTLGELYLEKDIEIVVTREDKSVNFF